MKCRWSVAPTQPALTTALARDLGVSTLLAQCLVNRGHTDPQQVRQFLAPRLRDLSDPFLLPNMEPAVARLLAARQRDEPLVIFGDYDVDGVTSVALLSSALTELGWRVHRYLPHRMEEGYGLSADGVANCLERHPVKLLLAVDCGSTAVASIDWLRSRGVDTIVLDHHQVSDPLPVAVALVNPLLGNRDHELCSVGLAFKLVHALVKRGRQTGLAGAAEFDLRPLLDLVALGTVADIVPLIGENRILVTSGIERLSTTQRPGLRALKSVAGVRDPIRVHSIGYQLGPRLNAAGRLENANEALDLLLASDPTIANAIAHALDSRNRERQLIERGIADEVIGAVRARFDPERDYVIVEGQLLWHVGVVGIVASRVLREFYRPTFILGGTGGEWRGSGRSIEGFDLAAALRQCDDLLLRHGGHAMAAGLSLDPKNLDAFRARLNTLARQSLKPDQLEPRLRLDAVVELREVSAGRLAELSALEPTGQANAPVQFAALNLSFHRPPRRMGAEQQHLKLWLTDGADVREAVWWNAPRFSFSATAYDVAFVPEINEFNGQRNVQLKILDLRPAG